MTDLPIGIIDSGSGGLSIWKNICATLPHESTLYIGDHGHLPYSKKTASHIRSRVTKLINFLLQRQVKMIVIACNTATVAGIETYRRRFPMIPIVGVVPVVKTAASISKKKCFAVLSTTFTAKSQYQKDLIKKFASDCTVYNLGCPNLVSYIEKGEVFGKGIERELTVLLEPTKGQIDVLALGCTHYPFLKETIRVIVGQDVQILDSGGAVARHVQRILEHNASFGKERNSTHDFFTTGDTQKVATAAAKLLGYPIDVAYAGV